MAQFTEFYPDKQGRPQTPESIDLETGRGALYSNYVILKEENVALEALLDKLLNEQIQQLEKLLIEARQVKLHLASLSGEHINEQDAEE